MDNQDLFEKCRQEAEKDMEAKMDRKIQELKQQGPIPKVREFELIFQNILTNFKIPHDMDDNMFEKPGILQPFQKFVKDRIEDTDLSENEKKLFKEFVNDFCMDEDIVLRYKELLDGANKEKPIFIYETVNAILTKLLEARK